MPGCKTPQQYRNIADEVAYEAIEEAQLAAVGRAEDFSIERPSDILRRRLIEEQGLQISAAASLGSDRLEVVEHWPEPELHSVTGSHDLGVAVPTDRSLRLTLLEALQVGARNSFEYQNRKEEVFRAALALDIERHTFRNLFSSELDSTYRTDRSDGSTEAGALHSGTARWSRLMENGVAFSSAIAVDLAQLLIPTRASSLGLRADASVTIPLLRGAGSHIVREPLTQAERDIIYAIWDFERYKQSFAVDLASSYLGVLRQLDQLTNAEENYNRLVVSARRARRLAEAGVLPQIQVDQAVQDELRARNRWISAQQSYARQLDSFKSMLGLPPDADVELDTDELAVLVDQYYTLPNDPNVSDETRMQAWAAADLPQGQAVSTAFENRYDLFVAQGSVYDRQRRVIVAADNLRAEVTLGGSARTGSRRGLGSATDDDASLRLDRATLDALLTVDLPLDRVAERNAYRDSIITLERSVRDMQRLEDDIKLAVRNRLRDLVEARETVDIQGRAVQLAEQRVASTDLFLQAGRAEIRDLLDSQEALLSARNALTAAVISYRVAELELERDMGTLEIDEYGLWRQNIQGDN